MREQALSTPVWGFFEDVIPLFVWCCIKEYAKPIESVQKEGLEQLNLRKYSIFKKKVVVIVHHISRTF